MKNTENNHKSKKSSNTADADATAQPILNPLPFPLNLTPSGLYER